MIMSRKRWGRRHVKAVSVIANDDHDFTASAGDAHDFVVTEDDFRVF